MPPKLGIVAGGGALPARLVAAAREQGREVFVLAITGHAVASSLAGVPQAWIRLGEAGRGLDVLREQGVEELVMAGPVRRPSLTDLRPDWRTARFFARLGLRALGDDGLLKAVIAELEEEGFRVIGLHAILGDVLAEAGVWGRVVPDAAAQSDIGHGLKIARCLGELDVGQSVVIQQGIVLGVEAIEGTDALLARCGELRRQGPGGVLVKISKPGQERRVDLPTIGVRTVETAAEAGLAGIAVEVGSTVVVDRPATVAAADAAGLFLCGVAAAKK
ncbi:UDP-2,3-diacylglucosamine diphosphatase LpxI domain-containing protein [Telmatospirillum sp.]|uniref:LpxI family protein n=1 Tax=Telmatospirillum sp. TaxID=2079197 RepID=UPI0028415694|nr:UDP-2,3-diacylglucosamine diphosphatase LpxI [Telmatospirillum sp.]MDR3436696.1 UDP-2,3-diacylglucosamine diphosphatase LpxI [Telmatospirillum sp.]